MVLDGSHKDRAELDATVTPPPARDPGEAIPESRAVNVDALSVLTNPPARVRSARFGGLGTSFLPPLTEPRSLLTMKLHDFI
jgi:hypothetical protein